MPNADKPHFPPMNDLSEALYIISHNTVLDDNGVKQLPCSFCCRWRSSWRVLNRRCCQRSFGFNENTHRHIGAELWGWATIGWRVNEAKAWWSSLSGEVINNSPAFPLLRCWLTWPQIVCNASPRCILAHGLHFGLKLTVENKGNFKGFPHPALSAWVVMMISPQGFRKVSPHGSEAWRRTSQATWRQHTHSQRWKMESLYSFKILIAYWEMLHCTRQCCSSINCE